MWLGHMSEKKMTILVSRGLLKGLKSCKLSFCENCVFGKQKRVKFSTAKHISKGILEYVHLYVNFLARAHYFLTLIDDYSRKVWVYFLKPKDEVLGKFKQWKAMVKNQTGWSVKTLRTDNCEKFCRKEFSEFCKNAGIVRHYTILRTPQRNGVTKQMNRTLLEHDAYELMLYFPNHFGLRQSIQLYT